MRRAVAAVAVVSASTFANAHLFISSPPPIAGSAVKDPLAGDGSNFPCHGVTFPGAGGQVMPVGSSQLLAFNTGNGANTAVHGGGSCQLSVTYETDPDKIKLPSSWYVIYSIEEGCPTNSLLNLDGTYTNVTGGTYTGSYPCSDPTTNGFDCTNQFTFNIPQGMKNGQATLAWTWFNTVGNREMYMNCVAIDITGGNSDYSGMSSMPDLFVANLAADYLGDASMCRTTEMTNVGFPNPGAYHTTRAPSSRIYVASATIRRPILTQTNCPSNERDTVNTSAAALSSSTTTAMTTSSTTTTVSANTVPTTTTSSNKATTTTKTAAKTTTTQKLSTSTRKTSTSTQRISTSTKKTSTSTSKASTSSNKVSASTKAASTTSKRTTTTSKKVSTTTKQTASVPNKAPATVKSIVSAVGSSLTTDVPTTTVMTSASTSTSTSAAAAAATTATNSCPANSYPCTGLNNLICIDASHFGICDWNNCAISQDVAPGTMCQDGMITWATSGKKREAHLRRHVRGEESH